MLISTLLKGIFFYCIFILARALFRGITSNNSIGGNSSAPKPNGEQTDRGERPFSPKNDGDILDAEFRVLEKDT